ncbi:MAG: hypothetical protein K2O24_09410 [Muribaculaceae bacterium]|nr:hypothetical protein [Muribaculaceae bacterium]
MKHLALLSLLTLTTPMWASTSAPSNIWQAKFSGGSLSGIVASKGQTTPVKGYYKHGFTEQGWTVDQFGSDMCALCPTSTNVETPINAAMRTPSFTIPAEGAVLTWSARSVLPGMEESYEVVIAEPDGTETVVATVEAESSRRFVTRSVSLEEFAGKNVSVIMRCTSSNKYMLAVKEMMVGNSSSYCVNARNTSMRYAQNAVPQGSLFMVTGELLNTGNLALPRGTELRAMFGNDIIGSMTLDEDLASAATLSFSFPADARDNATSAYEVQLVTPEGTPETLFESDVTRSYFVRNHFIDEGTGVWCNNCPQGALEIDDLEEEFPDQIIPVCTHVNDVFANVGYWPNLDFYAVPYFMLNRNHSTAFSDTRKFDGHLNVPTIAGLTMKKCEISRNRQQATVEIYITVSEDLNNASGRYGVGYVMTAPFYVPDGDKSFMQQNMSSSAKARQYYFLPNVIPSSLSFYRHVSLTSGYAFTPVPGSLPESVKAYDAVTTELQLNCPDMVPTIDEATLVAFVLDTTDGSILNAVSYKIGDEIDENVGTGMVTLGEEVTQGAPEYYTLQGIRVANPQAGQMVIERRGSSVRKFIAR